MDQVEARHQSHGQVFPVLVLERVDAEGSEDVNTDDMTAQMEALLDEDLVLAAQMEEFERRCPSVSDCVCVFYNFF